VWVRPHGGAGWMGSESLQSCGARMLDCAVADELVDEQMNQPLG